MLLIEVIGGLAPPVGVTECVIVAGVGTSKYIERLGVLQWKVCALSDVGE
tara:strand:+ start:11199 stop:11348 length:150 start_codon:yes stop_codon:yes gene_type:complete